MILNPKESIEGTISSTGNVILVDQPNAINVEELYRGKLIIRN